ncbi:DUF3180 domain-containing protein [Bifidobacterium amazonense]|uniref:DUF3180 domain-containing protein n=1 Tax=Bifidobacterium amazonense TaxID=2809027 RepID=A0ABS9VXA7_9BIFI|nr:DUF3180 domain-containing protein [Bifidobacterium amazonense]MCH9276736.1 DUF3180 domain-containing protein [Bifidobacterium amazonense]
MTARRTPWWYYLVAIIGGLFGGMLLAKYDETSGLALLGVPWFISALLLLIGVTVLVMALQVHKYATTDPRKRAALKPLDPQKAVSTLVLAKALGLVGAALAGWYGGQILLSVSHMEAAYYSQAVLECAIACVACVADMVIGIVGEWLCQLPPTEGPENPKMKAAQRQRNVASAAVKTRH